MAVLRDGYAHVDVHSCDTRDTPCYVRSLCCVSLTECTCCVCLCCAVARSLVQQCVTVLFARGVTEKSRVLSLSGSALPVPTGVTLIDPAARTLTVPHPGSHEHEVPSHSLSLESFVCRSHRGRVSSVHVRRCARESLSVSCPGHTGSG